jgi:hypothetical protein
MLSATLTSLAMLKVNIDQGKDYLDYLRPFILQVLVEQKPERVTATVVRDQIRTQFGLDIPERPIQLVLKRLSRKHPIKREYGIYRITGILPDPRLVIKKSEAERHIQAVVSGLIEFSKLSGKEISTEDEAITALTVFLSMFDISCLRTYLRGTVIPTITEKHDSDAVLVGQYILHLQKTDLERFESLMILVQGHMLANALLCPDLENAPKAYKGVTFYLDTPLLIHLLGLEGQAKQAAMKDLIELLHKLGGSVATFSHSSKELERVLKGAAEFVNSPKGRGTIVMEARRIGTSRSDLLLLAGKIGDKLDKAGIKVKDTPPYIAQFQIDETTFQKVLEDEVSYFNPHAKEYDINSVRSIYVLRKGTSPSTLEKSKAVLVTSNVGFARAASEYGQRHEESRDISSVITNFSLANMAWLKAPMGAPSLPALEVLALAYAALQPSRDLLNKYLNEIDKLERQGKITARDHQLLRSSTLAQDELMRLTLGDEEALTEETVTETLRRVSSEIKREESEKLMAEREAHRKTQQELVLERESKRKVQQRLYWRSRRKAQFCAWFLSIFIGVLIVAGLPVGLLLRPFSPLLGWVFNVGSGLTTLLTIGNLLFGATVKSLHNRVQNRCLTFFIKRGVSATGLNLEVSDEMVL